MKTYQLIIEQKYINFQKKLAQKPKSVKLSWIMSPENKTK